jgi:integrase
VIVDPRDLALFTLIYHHGLRVGEAALLRRGDVDMVRQRIVVWRLKHGSWSAQPLFARTAELLAGHLATIPAGPEGPLFPGQGGPLRKRQIQSLFTRYRDQAGLPRHFTCHSLRHSIATHLLDAGATLEAVQDRLGHQSIRSTSIYARITDHHRAALFQKLESSPWIVQPGEGGSPQEEPPCTPLAPSP